MVKSAHAIKVFVSSTSDDLADYRAVARNVILDMHWQPVMMEHFDAQPGITIESCRNAVEECQVVLAIIAWRQGWIPSKEQGGDGANSITAFELEHARNRDFPVLVLLANDSWPTRFSEDEQTKRHWVKSFRQELNQVAKFFDYEPPSERESERLPRFRALVRQTLLAHKERLLATMPVQPAALDFYQSARDGLLEGKDIPVLGYGVYGDGPLSSAALVRSIVPHAGRIWELFGTEHVPLATAAEYQERLDGSRDQFLLRFRGILDRQGAEAPVPTVLDLIANLNSVSLVVSATHDNVLEQRFEAAGRKYVTIAHVLRSFDGEKDGSILINRPGNAVTFCRADHVRTPPDECVIYKPQGSPFLNDLLDPELEIDTVVVTETDHATFLQRLESPETGVPGPVKSRFRRSPLLFLGYTMDLWQYRLMMLVFQSARRQDSRSSTRAVRVPETEFEEVAWNRLNASLIRMDPNQFALSAGGRGRGQVG
jgi:hypothetical protein